MKKNLFSQKLKAKLLEKTLQKYFPSNTKNFKIGKAPEFYFYTNCLFKLEYNGEPFTGLQYHTEDITVEHCLRYSFNKVGLINLNEQFEIENFEQKFLIDDDNLKKSPESLFIDINNNKDIVNNKFTFCGRTDAGVSGKSMPISIYCRINPTVLLKNLKKLESLQQANNNLQQDNTNNNLKTNTNIKLSDLIKTNYKILLNNFLPKYLRVREFKFVKKDFNARFDCKFRSYRYYFSIKNLDKKKLGESIEKLRKLENFKNFCCQPEKLIKEKLRHNPNLDTKKFFRRRLTVIKLKKLKKKNRFGHKYYLKIKAKSFLHNMIRKIFYYIYNNSKGSNIDIDSIIGTAPPDNLEFRKGFY